MDASAKAAFIGAQTEFMRSETLLLVARLESESVDGKTDPKKMADALERHIQKWDPILGYNALIEFLQEGRQR